MYVADFLKYDFKCWKTGESIFIQASTGNGKTTFVLKQLVKHAKESGKEVLFISNRLLLKEQIKNEILRKEEMELGNLELLQQIEEFDGITVVSYQKIQELMERKLAEKYYDGDRYMYTVMDEIHYILEDAIFNPKIEFFMQFLRRSCGVKVFLSATLEEAAKYIIYSGALGKLLTDEWEKIGENVSELCLNTYTYWTSGIKTRIRKYEIPLEKKMVCVNYFQDFEQVIRRINQSNEKWLVFISNKKMAETWSKKLEVSFRIVHAEKKEQDVMESIIRQEKFQEQVLIATKILDNGVNFKDAELKNIVIDTISKTEFIQMMGRKRVEPREVITVYIPQKNQKYFSGYYWLGIKKIQDLLEENGDGNNRLIQKILEDAEIYDIARRFYIYSDGKLKLNSSGKYKVELVANFLDKMQKALKCDALAFVKEQISWIENEAVISEITDLTFVEREAYLKRLQAWLKEQEGKWLNMEEQLEFRKQLTLYMEKIGNKPMKNTVGKCLISRFLTDWCPKYEIVVHKSCKKGERSLWMLRRREHGVGHSDEILCRDLSIRSGNKKNGGENENKKSQLPKL